MIRRPPRSTRVRSSAASDVYKRQAEKWGFLASSLKHQGAKRMGIAARGSPRTLCYRTVMCPVEMEPVPSASSPSGLGGPKILHRGRNYGERPSAVDCTVPHWRRTTWRTPMGWTFRRSVNLGPVRLNFGKRGLGMSAGVRGARIGVDSQQRPYVSGGRWGFYYREYLKPSGKTRGHVKPGTGRARMIAIIFALVLLGLLALRLF